MFVGKGYDLLQGNPLSKEVDPGYRHPIIKFTYDNSETT